MDKNYWIRGSKKNADKIKRTFGGVGISAKNVLPVSFEDENNLYVYDGVLKLFSIMPYNSVMAMAIMDSHHFDELELPVEPKFKVGDRIKLENGTLFDVCMVDQRDGFYIIVGSDASIRKIPFNEQDGYELDKPGPKFTVGDIIVSRKNQDIKYKILEVVWRHFNTGDLEYKLELLSTEFQGAKRYISIAKVDSWGELVASTE